MSYLEILEHIFQSFPVYHRVGSSAYKEGLENIEQLAEMAEHPEKKLQAIHIAGSNGKGSVAHLLASYFQELGCKTGLFTSPHLIDFRERIKINGKMISEQKIIDFIEKYQKKLSKIEPSFFEMTTILAFDYFVNEEVDIAIIETGLGGRLDATNILSPTLSVITNISLEHTKTLGNTFAKIAFEKAGIIKMNTPVVIGEFHPETFPIFEEVAKQKKAPLFLSEEYHGDLQFGGHYQQKNIGTFLKCMEVIGASSNKTESRKQKVERINNLHKSVQSASSVCLQNAIKNLYTNTGFMGRWQIISEKPFTICDVAHNPAGIKLVMKQLQELSYHHLHIIIGFANDKDVDEIIPLLPQEAIYYACQAQIERAMAAEELFQKLKSANLSVQKMLNIYQAHKQATYNAQDNDLIFIGGSFFVVGELLKNIENSE
ncbi:MAG: Mur ligase family protein [Lentimicrobiaceae bacterium]|nr:Mur ligase family protein [Lentimicrobiaceae bacterium]